MKSARERFEEIWPVPEGVYWCDLNGCYVTRNVQMMHRATDHDIRLDTFTRCQETTDVYVSLISELVASIERAEILICNIDAPTTGIGYSELMDWTEFETDPILGRVKQIMEQKK